MEKQVPGILNLWLFSSVRIKVSNLCIEVPVMMRIKHFLGKVINITTYKAILVLNKTKLNLKKENVKVEFIYKSSTSCIQVPKTRSWCITSLWQDQNNPKTFDPAKTKKP